MERTTMKTHRLAALAALTLATTAAAPAAQAAPVDKAFGGTVPCTTSPETGLVTCAGKSVTWDGTTVDVSVVLPSSEGGFPAIGFYHGWGGAKSSNSSLEGWAKKGYAAFSMS